MRKLSFIFMLSIGFISNAQEHFSGINTSKRVGILNATINPAELGNLSNKFEVNLFTFSSNISNNKVSVKDLTDGGDIEDKIFIGSEPVNARVDVNILGPSFAMKYNKWAFGFATLANIKANIIDVNVDLGNAVSNQDLVGVTSVNANYNQRVNAIAWAELGLSAARQFEITSNHIFTAGATLRLLSPGSYMNLGISNLNGSIINTAGNMELTNATAQLNIAYSGPLANDFSNSDNYYDELLSGGITGFAVDFGATYQWKPEGSDDYKLKAGASFRNMGSLTFKSDNNVNNQYNLDINLLQFESLNLNQFDGVENIQDIEDILVNSGLVTKSESRTDFKVKLPAVLNLYADYKIISKFHLSAYMQQKLSDDSENDFTTVQNILTLTPRFSTKFFEVYVPFSQNEISDFTTGVGFRIGGFFLGSGSAISALLNDSQQGDVYLGFRFGF